MKPTTIRQFINENLPRRTSQGRGHSITFKAKDSSGKSWTVTSSNGNPAAARRAVAVKDGTKGSTATTRKEFDFIQNSQGFVVTDPKSTLVKL